MSAPATWDILICSIEHRTGQLDRLLTVLDGQVAMTPEVGVRVLRDNLEMSYGAKCDALLRSSTADYVSFIDDDDLVCDYFTYWVTEALGRSRPDYVGFHVRYTEDGVPQMPVTHSLAYRGWHNAPDLLTRDIVHFNPIRREHALRGRWAGGNGADSRWADEVRAADVVQTEEFIPRELYYYQHTSEDTFEAPREPLTPRLARPAGHTVTWL